MNISKLISRSVLVLTIISVFGGCSGNDNLGTLSQLSSQIQSRETAYHNTVMSLSNADQIRQETNRYTQDMTQMLSQMQSNCSSMMTGHNGMMGNNDVTAFCGMRDNMMGAVTQHQERINEMTNVTAMKAECDDYYQTMQGTWSQWGGCCQATP